VASAFWIRARGIGGKSQITTRAPSSIASGIVDPALSNAAARILFLCFVRHLASGPPRCHMFGPEHSLVAHKCLSEVIHFHFTAAGIARSNCIWQDVTLLQSVGAA
jgi:hypothetical protein